MKIFLTGYMGSGKSAVGKMLAEKKQIDYLDLDQEISRKAGRSIREIFDISGEIFFRRMESETLGSLINRQEDLVVSLGGGTPCYGKNLEHIKNDQQAVLVYLKTGLKELTKRLHQEQQQRPLLAHLKTPDELEDFVRKHLFERTYYYNQSDYVVVTDGENIEGVVNDILRKLP